MQCKSLGDFVLNKPVISVVSMIREIQSKGIRNGVEDSLLNSTLNSELSTL